MKRLFQSSALMLSVAVFSVALLAGCSSLMMGRGPASMVNGVLAAPNGMTLYTFDRDTAGNGKSACNGPCASLWPPFMVQGDAAAKGDFSVVTRDDGGKQWAHKGKPLYFYKPDTKPGDMTGDNFRDVWHVIK